MQALDLQQLILKMQEGDEAAFEEVYRRFHTSLYYTALKFTKNEADAEDATQETFIRIQKNIHTLQNSSTFILWMRQILYNYCKNMFRKNRLIYMENEALESLPLQVVQAKTQPDTILRKNTEKEMMLYFIFQLPVLYSVPLYLKYYEDKTMAQIGKDLQIPTGTVKSRLRTAKGLLRKEILLFEETTSELDTFKALSISPLFLAFTKPSFLSKLSTMSIAMKIGSIVSLTFIIASPFTLSYLHSNLQLDADLRNDTSISESKGDQNAYYQLKKWAHCQEEMKTKTPAQIAQAKVWHEQLKKHNGLYWELLQEDNWNESFETLLK